MVEAGQCSVVGLGKLGLALAAVLSSRGFRVVGVDVDPEVVALVNGGRTRLQEPGLQELITAHRHRLSATRDHRDAVLRSTTSFIVVPTPSEPDGAFSLRFVNEAVAEIGKALAAKSGYHLVVVVSTVSPGSMESQVRPLLEGASGKVCGPSLGLCYNPAFISLGSVLKDLTHPDFILIGESDPRAGDRLVELHSRLGESRPPIARMNFVNAELAKLAVNTYVTTKISFANMLAQFCERLPGADVDVVTAALGLDSRIGPKYLKGGPGYGGPCFPRDNQALIRLARELRCQSVLAESTDESNRLHNEAVVGEVQSRLQPQMVVGILGLAYKPSTDVVDESAGIYFANRLIAAGYRVIVYDPLAMGTARGVLGDRVTYAQGVKACLQQADAVILATPSPEFRGLTVADFPVRNPPVIVFDCWRLLRPQLSQGSAVTYLPLGVETRQRTPRSSPREVLSHSP